MQNEYIWKKRTKAFMMTATPKCIDYTKRMVMTAVVYASLIHWITEANIWINLAIEVAFILNQLRVLNSQINQPKYISLSVNLVI